jgi:hypothetical protein
MDDGCGLQGAVLLGLLMNELRSFPWLPPVSIKTKKVLLRILKGMTLLVAQEEYEI